MNVLSVFDGMSCGQIALERAKIKVDNYFASEINQYAIKVTMKNYPNTIQLGSITDIDPNQLPVIDLLIGGSPCQGFSFAGKQLNFDDPRSKLFFEYVRLFKALKEKNHNLHFLLENVKMKQSFQDVISSYFEVQPIEINSALLSAQNRTRLYWTNIENASLPIDKNVKLKDILENDVDKRFFHTPKAYEYMVREVKDGRNHFDFEHHHDSDEDKSHCLPAVLYKGVPYNVLIDRRSLVVKEGTKTGFTIVNEGQCFDGTFPSSKTRKGRLMIEKSNCLTATPFKFYKYIGNGVLRKLTPIECERLQTVPDNYTECVSDTRRYEMLGNGWTVDVISHILSFLKEDSPTFSLFGFELK